MATRQCPPSLGSEPELAVSPDAPKDPPSVGADGRPLPPPIEDVELLPVSRHVDHRGSLTEVFTGESDFWREPIVYSYAIEIAPGVIKGWGMHRGQADRCHLVSGRVRTVLYDGRERSPSHGALAKLHFSDANPTVIRIPPGVWHAHQNYTDAPAVIVNFPTLAYDRSDPDKYRIDPASGKIPFDFALPDG